MSFSFQDLFIVTIIVCDMLVENFNMCLKLPYDYMKY